MSIRLPVWQFCTIGRFDCSGDNSLRLIFILGKLDLSGRGIHSMTALHLAVYYDKVHVVEFLVNKRSVDVNAQDERGKSALMDAIESGYNVVG